MKTFADKPSDVVRKWYIIDAKEASLGRISTIAAKLLAGKNKVEFTPHTDSGDFVIIVNAQDLVVTGKKLISKKYYRHSQYPGGIHQKTLGDIMASNPAEIFYKSVRGMLPDNKLRPGRLKRLKVYPGNEHEHQAQKPERIIIKEKI